MHLTAQLSFCPPARKRSRCGRTLAAFNAACDYISEVAWNSKIFRQFDLHKLCYCETRRRFGLSAQSAVRAISKIADAYKLDKKARRTFRERGSAAYDARILSWNLKESSVSIWSLDGRLKIPFVCGDRQRALLTDRKGESDLSLVRGRWYLMATCEVANASCSGATEFLGVDLGIVKVASDSDGRIYAGNELRSVRCRNLRLRRKLQKKQTRSAKRRLKKLSGKEARFARHTNHVISKEIVASAERTGRGIAIEELTGIRGRIRAGRKQRGILHSWAFAQLGAFLAYKAVLAGVPLVLVDPRNTEPRVRRMRPHRQTEQARPIDIPLRGMQSLRQRGYQRCPCNCG